MNARLLTASLLLAGSAWAESPAWPEHTAPAGAYRLDKAHASLVFRIDHIGYSRYTANFADFDAELEFDPQNPEAMSVTASIDPRSLALNAPPEGFHDKLMGPDWFNAVTFPAITFHSTSVQRSGPSTMVVRGEMALLGVTAPLSFEATFNGGYEGFRPYDPNARIGFSAHGSLRRTDWGFDEGLPPEGTQLGVGDEVEFFIEVEFNGPPAPEDTQAEQDMP